jgi:hypothetical protein
MLVFAVRGKKKIGSLYSPTKSGYSDYFEMQPVWIAEMASAKLSNAVVIGDMGYVLDVYELEDLPADLWGHYRRTLPAATVSAIEQEAHDTDGVICANVIHEDSLLGIEEGPWRGESLS